jgi:hypothetical protein
MLIFGIVFNLLGLGFLCWLLFALAVHALPVFIAATAGHAAVHSGVGTVGAILVTLVSGVVALFIGQIAFATAHSPLIRVAIATLFAVPAAVAGYDVTLGLAGITVSSENLREVLAPIGAILVGGAAWARVTRFSSPHRAQRCMLAPTAPCDRSAARKM